MKKSQKEKQTDEAIKALTALSRACSKAQQALHEDDPDKAMKIMTRFRQPPKPKSDVAYWVLSELQTSTRRPQRYVSESRHIKDYASACRWRDFVESGYRSKKDKRDVILVEITSKP